MYRHILIALEGKPTDEAAVAHAAALALQDSARITLLQVIGLAQNGGDGLRYLQLEPGASGWRRKNQAEARLDALEKQLRMRGLGVETKIILGDRSEADEIVDFAVEGGCDLIVMAADGRPWWRRALFGCIADGVHRKAAVPTLFVSDGTRRAKVAARELPSPNPMLAAFSHVECV